MNIHEQTIYRNLKGSQHKDNVQQNKTTKGQNSVGIVLV